jgi:hypothetical protein
VLNESPWLVSSWRITSPSNTPAIHVTASRAHVRSALRYSCVASATRNHPSTSGQSTVRNQLSPPLIACWSRPRKTKATKHTASASGAIHPPTGRVPMASVPFRFTR